MYSHHRLYNVMKSLWIRWDLLSASLFQEINEELFLRHEPISKQSRAFKTHDSFKVYIIRGCFRTPIVDIKLLLKQKTSPYNHWEQHQQNCKWWSLLSSSMCLYMLRSAEGFAENDSHLSVRQSLILSKINSIRINCKVKTAGTS
jgi:hypothetical protein